MRPTSSLAKANIRSVIRPAFISAPGQHEERDGEHGEILQRSAQLNHCERNREIVPPEIENGKSAQREGQLIPADDQNKAGDHQPNQKNAKIHGGGP